MLVILSVAVGLTNYLVNAQVPTQLIEWTQAHIESKRWLFLLALNVFLLLVGTVMDIFSAIVVVVPLILPLADVYGISYVHLGVIFIANLELGYLHPPLGLNLLLASYRFKKPVLEVTWATLPMLGILAIGVLLITYVPVADRRPAALDGSSLMFKAGLKTRLCLLFVFGTIVPATEQNHSKIARFLSHPPGMQLDKGPADAGHLRVLRPSTCSSNAHHPRPRSPTLPGNPPATRR